MASNPGLTTLTLLLILDLKVICYEKTLRKIVRNQSKMVQTPFSSEGRNIWRNSSGPLVGRNGGVFPGYQISSVIYKNQHPKMATIMSSEANRGKSTYSNKMIRQHENINGDEIRQARNTLSNITIDKQSDVSFFPGREQINANSSSEDGFVGTNYQISESNYFPNDVDHKLGSDQKDMNKNTIVIPEPPPTRGQKENATQILKTIFVPPSNELKDRDAFDVRDTNDDIADKGDIILQEVSVVNHNYSYNSTPNPFICYPLHETKTDINAQKKFLEFDIEASWITKMHYWNQLFDSRYEALMRNSKWPPLKVILIPRSHVDTIWTKSFSQYHNGTVKNILNSVVKKLQFYKNLTFTWNEISHLSEWWKTTSQKSRTAFRRLMKGGRLEITTGGWVETDEATTDLFGLLHILIEGHQWLKQYLRYTPQVGWLTNSVAHSPTMAYLLSASGISSLVVTNLHYSWEQYLAEYQTSDFLWVQSWDNDRESKSDLNNALRKIGNARHPKHSILTHYLPFNSDGFRACGPNELVCVTDFNFAKSGKNLDINPYNIKEKSEILLEQYSKTGTISSHNVIIAPIGGPYLYEYQTEFDYQYNNYKKIADFINMNSAIYKATVDFGTPRDYFNEIFRKHQNYPTVKGDFLNFADIKSKSPAYWTGYFTSRPLLKILLRQLEATLRTTEILFTFAVSLDAFHGFNSSELFDLLIQSRENVARLLDRNVISGTLNANALLYSHKLIIKTARSCWYIQEVSASLLSTKPEKVKPYVQKYVYRSGEFVSTLKTVAVGDQIYIFNSLSHERTEVVTLVTRNPNIRVIDHNKKDVTIQIDPMWNYDSKNIIKISKTFFKINFVIEIPPMTLELFKIKDTYDGQNNAATVYCLQCTFESPEQGREFNFKILPLEIGDIQLESYKHRLVFDETSGFLKTVIEKETNNEKRVLLEYGAFKSSDQNAGMFLFNTNVTYPLHDILMPYRSGEKTKLIMINAGTIITEITCIYGRLLQNTVRIYNLMSGPLSSAIYSESKVDFEISPKNRDIELFMSIQTDISNGNNPEVYIDNNGFQYTSHILNISRRIESNMYPITSMAYIQDRKNRLSIITDHAQGVTALQEGQLVVMLDRRILFNDGRGTYEGLADSTATCHRHFILLENFQERYHYYAPSAEVDISLPSITALYLSGSLSYALDVFIIDKKQRDLSYYAFLPLIKTSFPCDISVVNYRIVLDKQALRLRSPTTALLSLHRQVTSCQIESTTPNCNGNSSFTLSKILRNIRMVHQTNLVGTNGDFPITNCDKNNFPPMELKTLRVYF